MTHWLWRTLLMHKFDYLMIGNSTAAVGAIEAIRSIDASASIGVVSAETA